MPQEKSENTTEEAKTREWVPPAGYDPKTYESETPEREQAAEERLKEISSKITMIDGTKSPLVAAAKAYADHLINISQRADKPTDRRDSMERVKETFLELNTTGLAHDKELIAEIIRLIEEYPRYLF